MAGEVDRDLRSVTEQPTYQGFVRLRCLLYLFTSVVSASTHTYALRSYRFSEDRLPRLCGKIDGGFG